MDSIKALAGRGWRWFRGLPWWGQALGWLLLTSVIFGPFIDKKDDDKSADADPTTATVGTSAAPATDAPATATEPTQTDVSAATTAATTPAPTTPPTTSSPAATAPSAKEPPPTDLPSSFTGLNPSRIFARDFDPWPFSVDTGLLKCDGDAVTFGTDDGTVYAVNGTALGIQEERGWADAEAIWLDNTTIAGTKINIGEIIDLGLSLC